MQFFITLNPLSSGLVMTLQSKSLLAGRLFDVLKGI